MNTLKVEQIPVLHVRGTHYEVGFSIGRTYMNLIQEFLETWPDFQKFMLPVYGTEKGKEIYESALKMCKDRFPQYVQEMQGISDGANIPFHQIFLLHIETLIVYNGQTDAGSTGCTSIICNNDDIILGHTEDAAPEMKYNFFIVCAQVVDDDGEVLEDWSTLTYPGYLPGYTMGYNSHGIVYSINTLTPSQTFPGRTPVFLITRALLAAKTKEECLTIIKDEGIGIADGFSFNLISANEDNGSEPLICNIEIGPNQEGGLESEISVLDVKKGESSVHCNKYLRLTTPEKGSVSSCRRHAAIDTLPPITSLVNVKDALSDQRDKTFPVYRNTEPKTMSGSGVRGYDHDYAATVAVGLFDIKKKTWSIYANKPNASQPVVVLPMNF